MTWFVLLSKHYDWCDWLPISGSCLLLDRKPSTTSKWGRFPTDAKCDHQVFPANQTCDNGTQLLIQAGWRLSPPFCQYLHIQAVHPPLLQVRSQLKLSSVGLFLTNTYHTTFQQANTEGQASDGNQDEELWICVIICPWRTFIQWSISILDCHCWWTVHRVCNCIIVPAKRKT